MAGKRPICVLYFPTNPSASSRIEGETIPVRVVGDSTLKMVGFPRRANMAASTQAPIPATPSNPTTHAEPAPPQPKDRWPWLKYVTPILVLLLAAAVVLTLTRNWNAWEGGRIEQVTDDAIVRGDLTPLSTKVAAIVRTVKVTDDQKV